MNTKFKAFFFFFLLLFSATAQTLQKITGPLAVYHIAEGYTPNDSLGLDSVLIQEQFHFGELAIPNQGYEMGNFAFQAQLDSALKWHANRVFGIIQPPSEHGIENQLADTLLLSPFRISDYPGMLQGAHRFSELSKQYGGISGIILDDWNGDTARTHQLYDAIKGKEVNNLALVEKENFATTPKNKLYCVLYATDARPEGLPYMDGLYYSYYRWQNCCYANLDADIDKLKINFPHKEIMFAIFLKNSALGWTDPQSVHYLLSHALNRYDDGDINQVNLFAGSFLQKQNIPLQQWNALALPHWLDSLYFPFLGMGNGQVFDCNTNHSLEGATIRVFTKSKTTGDTLTRSVQRTDNTGTFQFGLWAGNRNTDSTYYWLTAEKDGYYTASIGFWIKRGSTTTLPALSLCPGIDGTSNSLLAFPNPNSGSFTVEIKSGLEIGSTLEIYSLLGVPIYSTITTGIYTPIDLSNFVAGNYLVIAKKNGKKIGWCKVVLI